MRFFQLRSGGIGRIEPAVAQFVEFAGGGGDGILLLGGGFREREGFETGRGGVAKAGFCFTHLGSHCTGPKFVGVGVQDAEGVVIVAGRWRPPHYLVMYRWSPIRRPDISKLLE